MANWCLIDSGNDVPWPKLAASACNGAFFPTTDPPADVARRLLDTKARTRIAGVFSAWNWYEGIGIGVGDGAAFAEHVHEELLRIEAHLGGQASNSFPKVQLDNEDHRPTVILAMLSRWRQLRPKHDTSWTLESMQGGWMTSTFVSTLLSYGVRVVPQCYRGRMANIDLRASDPETFYEEVRESLIDPLVAARDLTKRGVKDSLITPYYDAAFLPRQGWDGFAFTMGRLPT